jgi:hypothetical protein
MVLEKGVNSKSPFKTNKDLTNNHLPQMRLLRRNKYSFSLQMYFFFNGCSKECRYVKTDGTINQL